LGQGRAIHEPFLYALQDSEGRNPLALTPSVTRRDGKPGLCEPEAGGRVRCSWAFADIPTERERFAQQPDPWIVAVPSRPTSELFQTSDDAEVGGPTVPPAQLRPTSHSSAPIKGSPSPLLSRTPLPTPTVTAKSAPLLEGEQGMQVSMGSMGSLGQNTALQQATSGASQSRATISPADRQWLIPGSAATWTIGLESNQHGGWMVHVADHDARIFINVDGPCTPIGDNGQLCTLPGATRALPISVRAGFDAVGLTTDLVIAVTDADSGRGGPVVGDLRLQIGVGIPPAATLTPLPASPPPVILPIVEMLGIAHRIARPARSSGCRTSSHHSQHWSSRPLPALRWYGRKSLIARVSTR
jgi:hypothetical protein